MAAFASGQAEVNTVLRLTTYLPCCEFSAVVPQKRVYSVPDPDPEIREGGWSSRPLDKGGGGGLEKFFFGPQFGPKIRGEPDPSPGSATVIDRDTWSVKTNKHPRPNFA